MDRAKPSVPSSQEAPVPDAVRTLARVRAVARLGYYDPDAAGYEVMKREADRPAGDPAAPDGLVLLRTFRA